MFGPVRFADDKEQLLQSGRFIKKAEHPAARWFVLSLAGAVLVVAGLFRLAVAFMADSSPGMSRLDGVAYRQPDNSLAPNHPATSFQSAEMDVGANLAADPELLVYEDGSVEMDARQEIASLSIPAVATESGAADAAAANQQKRQILGARVNSEANRILSRVARKYRLSDEQQAQVFPTIASSVPAYDGLAENLNRDVPATELASLGIAPDIVDWSVAERADEAADSPATADTDAPETAATPTAGTATPSKARASLAGDDAYEAALKASMEAIEEQLASYLNNAQLRILSEEQADRYFWWGEILIQLKGDVADEAASADSTSGDDSAGSGTSSGSETGDAAVSADHQGGTLFDLLGSESGTSP